MTQYSGKIIRKTPVVPTQTSASGVWTRGDAASAVKSNTWPVAGVPNPISRSVRLRSSATAYLNRTFGTPTSGTTWTWSGWVKLGTVPSTGTLFEAGTGASNTFNRCTFGQVSAELNWRQVTPVGGLAAEKGTSMLFRDSSAWYHIVCVWDTSNATSTDRQRVYVNGVRVTSFSANTDPSLNLVSYFNTATYVHYIGALNLSGISGYLDGYLTEVNFIDGQALTPSSFGTTDATTGAWIPMPYTGTYGTNGFYLNFKDNTSTTTLGYDYSGNSNHWTTNNISLTAGSTYDSMVDVPTLWMPYNTAGDTGALVRGNYAVMNPLTSQGNTVSDGNLKVTLAASSAAGYGTRGSIAISSGNKFYWEISPTTTSSVYTVIGIIDAAYKFGTDIATAGSNCVLYYKSNGNKIVNGTTTSYGTTYAANDVIGVAVDYSANTCTFYLNNVSQGAISLPSTSIDYIPVVGNENLVADVFQANFGQRPFSYTPPTGFKSLNTFNLPTPTISSGANYMAATTYTGTNANRSVTNSGSMQPDLVWLKSRSNVTNHMLNDSVRGVGIDLYPNLTNAESNTGLITSFNSNGFSLGPDGGGAGNGNGLTYVGWQWKRAPSAGFDIVACTTNSSGILTATSHNLGVVPAMVILKARAGTDAWYVYHQNSTTTPTQGTLQLNSTAAVNTTNGSSGGVDKWTLTSTTFAAGNAAWTYQASTNHIAYLFAAVAGYSAFGSYTGNGSTDGPFVYTGFRPRWIMIKRTDLAAAWTIIDTSVSPYNVTDAGLLANSSGAQSTGAGYGAGYDILSNGFKARLVVPNEENVNNATHVYAAFAENPFKNSNAR